MLPLRETVKSYRISPGWQLRLPAAFYAARYRSYLSVGVIINSRPCGRGRPVLQPYSLDERFFGLQLVPVRDKLYQLKYHYSEDDRLKRSEVLVSEEELARRRAGLTIPECPVKKGWLARYAKLVGPVSGGAVLED